MTHREKENTVDKILETTSKLGSFGNPAFASPDSWVVVMGQGEAAQWSLNPSSCARLCCGPGNKHKSNDLYTLSNRCWNCRVRV